MPFLDFLWAKPANKYFPEFEQDSLNKSLGVNPAEYFLKYGMPRPIADLKLNDEFVSCYNRMLRNPYWVIEHVTTESRNAFAGDRSRSFFKEDFSIPEKFRARLTDYFRSGYDRGHQAPAANARYSQKAMDESFNMCNVSPQVGEKFNRDYWAHFERFARNLTKQYKSVRIITGPLFMPVRNKEGKSVMKFEVIGSPPNVAVPTHFFKIMIGEGKISDKNGGHGGLGDAGGIALGAFILPNEEIENSKPLTDFEVPLDQIERTLGLEFMPENKEPIRKLCEEVQCAIEIREFAKNIKK